MATVVRWEPFRELAALQNDMGRLMSTFLGQDQAGGENGQRSWMPAVDVWESENELVYAFDLPGIPEEKISVEYDDGALTVSGERERTDEVQGDRFYRYERRFGSFSRTVGLPQGVTEEGIKADYRNGVLEIHVPKPEIARPRRIQIGSADQATIEGSSKQK
ncbi:MAG TPA: Hsp20/alpha crystallin family protein [Gaiellaceae bacterium]|nr:Hsp20/alpha crystallin family protein [Gaiellaceae bacterium]HET8651499.1 Hsp20/alpha crystallin family protein [Gaiellaceae bacterium]